MGCTVILGCRQQPSIVGLVELLHQRRNKLICRQASQGTVFRGHDHVEAPCRLCNHFLPGEPVQGELGRIGGHAKRLASVTRQEVIASGSGKGTDIVLGM